jgi:beta-phosphoglucomutase-like phosphatase (HAD superfamily)
VIECDLNRLDAVCFDIGGVIAADFWETIYFDQEKGIAKQLGLNEQMLHDVGIELWQKYSVDNFEEGAYWEEFAGLVGRKPSSDQLIEAETAVWADPTFAETIVRLKALSKKIYIVSDNTAFWLPKQLKKLNATTLFGDNDIVASSQIKKRKKTKPRGAYAVLGELARPDTTLVLEDRESNVEIASGEGFRAVRYTGSAQSRIISVFKFT